MAIENLKCGCSKMRYVVSIKYTLDFKDLLWKNEWEYFIGTCFNDDILAILV